MCNMDTVVVIFSNCNELDFFQLNRCASLSTSCTIRLTYHQAKVQTIAVISWPLDLPPSTLSWIHGCIFYAGKNLLTKGCTRLKHTIVRRKGDHSRVLGWMDGQHSPPSFAQSNCTSYASLRTAICRNDVGKQTSTNTKSYGDLTLRQAWDFDTALAEFHPSVSSRTVSLGFDEDEEASSPKLLVKTVVVLPVAQILENKAEVVTCTFSTPSSCVSEKCLRQ